MAGELFISLDAGTSMVKAVLMKADGETVAVAAEPNEYTTSPDGGVEQDLAATWDKAARVLSQLAAQLPDAGTDLVALAVTGQGDGTWLIDAAGEPVGGGLLWLDTRAAEIVNQAQASGARELIFRHTGCGLNTCNQSSQLAWLGRNQPDRLAQADCAMHCKDWLYYQLTGERVTDVSEAMFTFGDYHSRAYCDEILDALDIAAHKRLLPPFIDGCKQTHQLGAAAARRTGLPTGLPVSLGCVDVVCSALGGCVRLPGENVGVTIIGTTGMHMRFIESAASLALPAEPSGYTMMPGGFPDSLLRMQSNMSATLNIDWLVQLYTETAAVFGPRPQASEVLARLDELAGQPTGVVYHPYIQAGERGPFFNPRAKAQFSGLDFATGPGDLARAVLEGLAFASRHCYEATGMVPDRLHLIGGGSRSAVMRQALADTLGAEVRQSELAEASAAGAMMMAAVAAQLYPDMATALAQCAQKRLGPPLGPGVGDTARLDGLYRAYVKAAEAAAPVWDELAAAAPGLPSP